MATELPAWLEAACLDAERRGLPELKPLLETLARSTEALRRADDEFAHPGEPDSTIIDEHGSR